MNFRSLRGGDVYNSHTGHDSDSIDCELTETLQQSCKGNDRDRIIVCKLAKMFYDSDTKDMTGIALIVSLEGRSTTVTQRT